MAAKYSSPFILTNGPVRLAFCQLRTPKLDRKGKPKYGATLLIPKTPGKSLKDDTGVIIVQVKQLISDVLKNMRPNGPIPAKLGVRDGDLPNTNGKIANGFPGNWIVGCTGNFPVDLYDASAQKTLNEALFHSGSWVVAQINAFWFDVDNSQGVSFGLGAAQFHHDDASLGGPAAPAPNFTAVPGSQAAGGPSGDKPADMFAGSTAPPKTASAADPFAG